MSDEDALDWTDRIVRWSLWTLAASLVVLLLTGLPLISSYHPARRLLVQDAHWAASLVFALASLVLAITVLVGRIRHRSLRIGLLAAVVIFLLGQVGGASGLALAWDQLTLASSGPPLTREDLNWEGIFAALEPEVVEIGAEGRLMTPTDYQVTIITHLLVVPLALVATYALSRRRRTRGEADAGEAPTPTADEAPTENGIKDWVTRARTAMLRRR